MNRFDMARAWLAYYVSRVRPALRRLVGLCPSCPGRVRGPHKFGCARAVRWVK